ncbi:PepSY domain-containing protein [Pseudorhodobacter sp. MZDSW-24AT]|uniref:PepSY domain-containing protein n=1 Tax=Pseudorhodobacter sp. MZDSW-24AT TaxID=2052957 RepID=UPI0012FD7E4E|nr:PepSY domain-containing protein [Pseudorhodobacter sp. MZDSW-24AT]
MTLKVGVLVLGLMLPAGTGFALTAEQAIADLQAAGYSRVEVKRGLSQMKVEAIRGTEKLELVLDRATGAVLKREQETVRPGETTTPGVSIRDRNRDFVRGGSASEDDDDNGRRGRGSDDAPGDDRGGDRDDDDRDDDDRDDDDDGDDDDRDDDDDDRDDDDDDRDGED